MNIVNKSVNQRSSFYKDHHGVTIIYQLSQIFFLNICHCKLRFFFILPYRNMEEHIYRVMYTYIHIFKYEQYVYLILNFHNDQ